MKSIQNQYTDLKEGRMSQANFMRNLRMTMPQYVTNVTSFNDAVKILKNKGILTEMRHFGKWAVDDITPEERAAMDQVINKQWMKSFNSELETRKISPKEKEDALEAIDKLGPEKLKKMYGMLQTRYAVNAFLGDVDEILSNETLSEGKTKLTADQVNNDELRMGIKVEMEHTDDPEKAKKIALDHLAENPFYYTQLKLSGVDTKALPSKEKKAIEKKKNETEMVDKKNQMKTPKGVEKVKASANKAKKETNKPEKGIKMMSLVSKTSRGVKKMDATGEKMKKIKEGMEDFVDSREYDNLDAEYEILNQIAMQAPDYESAVVALEDYGVDSQLANSIAANIHPEKVNVAKTIFDRNANITRGINKIAGIEEKLREAIRKMIKQEIFDGRDNMTDAVGHQLDENKEIKSVDQALDIPKVQSASEKLAQNPALLQKAIEELTKLGIDKNTLMKASQAHTAGQSVDSIIEPKVEKAVAALKEAEDFSHPDVSPEELKASGKAGAKLGGALGAIVGFATTAIIGTSAFPLAVAAAVVLGALGAIQGSKSAKRDTYNTAVGASRAKAQAEKDKKRDEWIAAYDKLKRENPGFPSGFKFNGKEWVKIN